LISRSPTSAFYVVANSRHFLGLVALVNSLRLAGHWEPIFVADCGLEEVHRRRLADQVTFVELERTRVPHLAKTVAPLQHPEEVMVLVDADVIITRPITDLVEKAAAGKLVAFADRVAHRFDERWPELLGLGPLRRQPYANAGLIAVGGPHGKSFLEQLSAGYERVDSGRTFIGDGGFDEPFYYVDQDVMNAVLAASRQEHVLILDHELAPFPPFQGLRVVDEATLKCRYENGVEPYALHHVTEKPWLSRTRWNPYCTLMRRLLLDPDLPIRVRRDEVPLRLQTGTVAALDRSWSSVVARLAGLRGRLGLRRALATRKHRRTLTDGHSSH
jgi:hypothetical protein